MPQRARLWSLRARMPHAQAQVHLSLLAALDKPLKLERVDNRPVRQRSVVVALRAPVPLVVRRQIKCRLS
jgi:hypothetical protein